MDKPKFRIEQNPNTYSLWCSNCGEIAKDQITTEINKIRYSEINKIRYSHDCETFKQEVQHRNVFDSPTYETERITYKKP